MIKLNILLLLGAFYMFLFFIQMCRKDKQTASENGTC